MSRTYKDRPEKIRFPDSWWGKSYDDRYDKIEYEAEYTNCYTKAVETYTRVCWVKKPGVFRKQPRHSDIDYHWVHGIPSWFTKVFMNRPARKKANRQCREALKAWDIGMVDIPDTGDKPVVYYY